MTSFIARRSVKEWAIEHMPRPRESPGLAAEEFWSVSILLAMAVAILSSGVLPTFTIFASSVSLASLL
jgi:hypothetical protein